MDDYSGIPDKALLTMYQRMESALTYSFDEECRRMARVQDLGREIQRRGLNLPR